MSERRCRPFNVFPAWLVDGIIIGCCCNCARVGTLASWSGSAARHILCLLVDIADLITSEDYSTGVALTRRLAGRLVVKLAQEVWNQLNEQVQKGDPYKTRAESNVFQPNDFYEYRGRPRLQLPRRRAWGRKTEKIGGCGKRRVPLVCLRQKDAEDYALDGGSWLTE